jgi:polysaccharide export outer membrane protein
MQRYLWLLAVALLPSGCATWSSGTIPPDQIAPELQAASPKKVSPLQLAALGGPVQAEYRIQPGDLLDVTVSDLMGENITHSMPVRVQEDGTVLLPLAGTVSIKSLSLPDSERVVFASYTSRGLLRNPQVTVALRDTRKVRINVLGAVNKAGQVDLNGSENDLLSALVAAGGLTADAGTTIEIHRRLGSRGLPSPRRENKQPSIMVNRKEPRSTSPKESSNTSPYAPVPTLLSTQNDPSSEEEEESFASMSGQSSANAPIAETNEENSSLVKSPEAASQAPQPQILRLDLAQEDDKKTLAQGISLRTGDTIIVEERKTKPIYVVGMVNKPGEFKIAPDRSIRVLEAIGLAGGVDRMSLPNKAVIVRQKADESGLVTVRVDINRAKRDITENVRLMPGDTVSVEETVLSYLRGLLRGALRFGVGADIAPTLGI